MMMVSFVGLLVGWIDKKELFDLLFAFFHAAYSKRYLQFW
jgi:hypothetical protein